MPIVKRVAIDTAIVHMDSTRRDQCTMPTICNVKSVRVIGRYPLIEIILMKA